jgi:hypothetical protein
MMPGVPEPRGLDHHRNGITGLFAASFSGGVAAGIMRRVAVGPVR